MFRYYTKAFGVVQEDTMSRVAYKIDQETADGLARVWIEAGMPDAIMVYDPARITTEIRDRRDVVSHMDSEGLKIPMPLRNLAQLADPPMLRSFWVAVLLPDGVQYARVSALCEETKA